MQPFDPLLRLMRFKQYVAMTYIKSAMLDRELKKGSAELLILSCSSKPSRATATS